MFHNLQLRPARPHRRKPSLTIRAGVTKRRVSTVSAASASNVPSMSFMESLFGEEFPEAFRSADGRPIKSRTSILVLPAELLSIICDDISKLDIKRLRLASKHLANKVDLRINRVYISPNRANLHCLQKLLDHPRYKDRVREIVWDDAQLDEFPTLDKFRDAILLDERDTTRAIENRLDQAIWEYRDNIPEYLSLEHKNLIHDGRLTDAAKDILLRYGGRFSRDVLARNATMMSIEDSYALYQSLYQQEQDIMKQQLDVAAVHQALAGFPNIRRVTLTSEVWRSWDIHPRYNTPFYRSLPPGFRKPIVWPWLGPRLLDNFYRSHLDIHKLSEHEDRLPVEFRGYDIVVSAILQTPNSNLKEFIIDSENGHTGISHYLFLDSTVEYQHTIRMFQRTPLRHLQLTINPYWESESHPMYKHIPRQLTYALAQMQHLEHLDVDLNWGKAKMWPNFDQPNFCLSSDFLPDNIKKQLKIFALRGAVMSQSSVYDLLTTLPNVQQVTLSHIHSKDPLIWWDSVFYQLKSYYATVNTSKPRYTVIGPLNDHSPNRSQLVDEEVDAFLYGDGECPLIDTMQVFPDLYPQLLRIKEHVGWLINGRDQSVRKRIYEVDELSKVDEWME
ncbi:hypothetical protein BDW02DRAFT_565317 [Decorospora gaudefroyi]|uniref:F-box domain-containing protein n=1 Tax=Decorospora gaudefroyi TaxID=184978 RepID=A0A6A5KWN8_9PLEO|nr:hypothetical protein BDW02DRAFT_565317 [Decorospora gaudefroyi]